MNKLKIFILVSFMLGVIIAPVIAQPTLAAFFEAGENLSISVPLNDDLYAAGCPVTIDENVNGDAVIAGCMVNVNADIADDLIIVGGVITIDGNVGDDVRAAGGEVTINSVIEDDLFVGAGTVRIGRTAVIKGDLIVGGGRVEMDGTVLGNVKMGAGLLMLNGPVRGHATIYGGAVTVNNSIAKDSVIAADDIIMGSKASFGGALEYWTKKGELDLTNVSIAGGAIYNPDLSYEKYQKDFEFEKFDKESMQLFAKSIWRAYLIFKILSAAVIILVLILLTKKFFGETAKKLGKETLSSFLAGLVYFIITPIVAIILFFTIIGAPLGGILLVTYGLALYLATIVSAMVLAYWVDLKWKLKWNKVALFFLSLVIYAVLMALLLVPFVGWLAKLILICLAFGAFLLHEVDTCKKVL